MSKFTRIFMFLAIPLLAVLAISCDDDVIDDPLVPAVTAVDPIEGAVGDQIIITGTGFDEVTTVRFGTVDVVSPVITPTQITATVPAGVTVGSQPITVISPTVTTDPFDFTVIN